MIKQVHHSFKRKLKDKYGIKFELHGTLATVIYYTIKRISK
jgi:hypothetical protein